MTQQIAEKLTYKRTFVLGALNFAASSTGSDLFDCGGMQPRGLLFPSTWVSCNIVIKPAVVPDVTKVYTLYNVDGSGLAIPTVSGMWLPLLAYLSDAIPYFQITCDQTQTSALQVSVALEPVYQGIHG